VIDTHHPFPLLSHPFNHTSPLLSHPLNLPDVMNKELNYLNV